jgi:CysZ protein
MIKAFLSGFSAYFRALGFISQHRLWGYFLAPALISLVLGLLIFGTAWGVSGNLGDWLISFYPWEWGKSVIERIVTVFGAVFIIALGLILFKHLVMALASPFMSPLSEKTEEILSGRPSTATFSAAQMLKDLVRGLRLAIRNIVRELFFTLLLFLVGLIPIFSPFVSIAIFIVQAYYAGFGNMDFTLERHYNVRGSVRFVRQHRGLAIGNGTFFLLLLFTGIGFLVALPLGTVAAAQEMVPGLRTKEG